MSSYCRKLRIFYQKNILVTTPPPFLFKTEWDSLGKLESTKRQTNMLA